MPRSRLGALLLLVVLPAACATPPDPARCGAGLGQPMRAFTLFFGQSVRDRADVTPAEWRNFIEDTVTPALPNGFTVFDARGAWLSSRAERTVHEATKVIVVALPDAPDSLSAVNRVRAAYETRFNQQLVGMTAQPICGTF
jgi:hypothetical protein